MNRLEELKAKDFDSLTDDEKVELKKLEAEAKKSGTEETEVEIGPSVMKELKATIQEAVQSTVKEEVSKAIEGIEKVVDKGIHAPQGQVKDEIEKLPKEVRFVRGLKAMLAGDTKTLGELNRYAISKTGYQNETTNADGGFLVPDPDFIAEVERLEEQFGVVAKDFRKITVNSDSVKLNKKDTGVTMVETGEGVSKTGTKMTFGQDTVVLRKFAGIAAVTDELSEDMATNVFNELATDFAREAARIEDVLGFTDAATGITRTAGTAAISVGANITDLDFDDLNNAIYAVPTGSMMGGKFYFHRTLLGLIQRIKDLDNNYIWQPGPNGAVTGTIWGFPYELVEVLNDINVVGDANEPFIVFGNPRFSILIRKAGLKLTTLTEATITDSEGSSVNLAEQDITGVRAVIRRNNLVQFPAAFALIGTGTVS